VAWDALNVRTQGRLVRVHFPLADCIAEPTGAASAQLFRDLRNPYFIGDTVGLTETLGWVDAWTTSPSIYAVAARTTADVVAAVNFAREHRLRLVVKGGGHSYLGGSNAPDSLMVWTRAMNDIVLHDAFVPQGGEGRIAPQPAVSVGAGAYWLQAYEAVTTKGGRYVQGGGCTTVGVAGLVQGGGFGSFSKAFGTGAAGVLEAEIVTADGAVRIANPSSEPDLFWAIKGGGGGTFGVVTRLTLRTHELPPFFGAVSAKVEARSPAAYRALVSRLVDFYAEALMNPHWGEQISFRSKNVVGINMVFQGLDEAAARATWRPFFDWVASAGEEYKMAKPRVLAIPAKLFWDGRILGSIPGVIRRDNRPGAPADHFYWDGDADQVGWVIHAYRSVWLPSALLAPRSRGELADALFATAQVWGVSLHCNKGLAGAPPEALAASRDTSTNPAVLDAFALAISGAGEDPAYPGIPGYEPDLAVGRFEANRVAQAMAPLEELLRAPASYVSETNYFEPEWRRAFWGDNYPRLAAIKSRYDPEGLFFVHHGVGSEHWSPDGFTRLD
jgi:FAD/FMN-containing dehydrogenase